MGPASMAMPTSMSAPGEAFDVQDPMELDAVELDVELEAMDLAPDQPADTNSEQARDASTSVVAGRGLSAPTPPSVPFVAVQTAAPMERHDRPGPMPNPMPGPARPVRPMGPRPEPRPAEGEDGGIERTATAPQLRRFIKSRAYVPMHELRRRFAINGGDDEVTPVDLEPRKRVFVGLPEREGRLLGELLRAGDIGYELSLDPISPIVVGVYPMRPVTRV
jgi:hypothetical protein